jgi:small subunit ribosomal protein S20
MCEATGNVACWLAYTAEPRMLLRPGRSTNRGREPPLVTVGTAARTHTNHSELQKVINVANIKSQMKRILTNKKATDRNKAVRSEVKTAVRATREAVVAGDKDKAAAALLVASKKLDKAASKGVMHKNQAANRKSAMSKQINAL